MKRFAPVETAVFEKDRSLGNIDLENNLENRLAENPSSQPDHLIATSIYIQYSSMGRCQRCVRTY